MTLSLEEMKANRKLWADALRSGKYRQTQEKLKARNGAMCCLGVLCDVAAVPFEWDGKRYYANGTWHSAPDAAMDFVGLRSPSGTFPGSSLAEVNDGGKSFLEIADLIESEPAGLFEVSQP